jgi:hypothetical protein
MPSLYTGASSTITSRVAPAASLPIGSDAPSAASVATPMQTILDLLASIKASAALLGSSGGAAGNSGGLSVDGLVVDAPGTNTGTLVDGIRFGSGSSGEGIASKRTAGGNQNGLELFAGGASRLSIAAAGGVTIPGALSVAAGTVVIPPLVNGVAPAADPLRYWKDVQGVLHIQGVVNSLSIPGTASSAVAIWGPGTLGASFAGKGPKPCVIFAVGYDPGTLIFGSDGSMSVQTFHQSSSVTGTSMSVDCSINPTIA